MFQNVPGQYVVDFTMSRDGLLLAGARVEIGVVAATVTQQDAASHQ